MLKRRILLTAILALVSASVFAQSTVEKQLIQGQPIYSSSPGITGKSKQSDHCAELARKVEALKGKPQRRYAAAERYKQECTGGN